MTEVEIVDFPRGGAQVLTPLETRKIKESAKKDVLFGNVEPDKKRKKKNHKREVVETKESSASLKKIVVSHFTFKYLVKDLLVLGYVKEKYKSNIVIGLSNGLSGYMSMSDLQSSMSQLMQDDDDDDDDNDDTDTNIEEKEVSAFDLFTIGQMVPASVKNLYPGKTGYQKISLSVLPKDVNVAVTSSCLTPKMLIWGRVESVEDHGYTISFGKDKISGFLRKQKESLKVGMLRWFCVEKVNANKKVVNLSVDQELVNKAQINDTKVHFNSLLPGQLVKLTVTETSDDGLFGKVCESFDAVVESLHVMSHEQTPETFSKKKVNGRIIHVNPKTKQIGISVVPDVVTFSENIISTDYKVGDIIDDCEVIKFENSYGLFMRMPNEKFGVVHISRISDEHTEKIGKRHKTGTSHSCRVLGYSALDSAYTLTMKKSDMEKPFLRYEDLKGGMKISGEVISLEDFGCLIKITSQIRGLCPKLHLADINLTHPEKKFVEGKKLKFRVLHSKPESRKLILTHKKTLMKSKLPLLLSLEDIKVGEIVHGFISNIKDFGMFVTFYNEIKALLPKSEVNIPKNSTLENSFYVGQVVQCTVIAVKKEENRLVVSLKDGTESQPIKKSLRKGEILTASLDCAADNGVLKMLANGCECILPVSHYSDFSEINEEWMVITESLKKDFAIKDSVIFGYYKKTKQTIISQKQVLIKDTCMINKFEDLKVGMVCGGVVSHIMSYGVFVEVAPNVTGLVPISVLADGYVKDLDKCYHVGQSLVVKVNEIDEEKHRFLIGAKPSLIYNESESLLNDTFSGCSLVKIYLLQKRRLFQDAINATDATVSMLPSMIGEIVITKVTKVEKDGVTLSYVIGDEFVEGFIHSSLRYGRDFEIGKECQCYVYSVDLKKKRFIATSNEEAITAVVKWIKKKKEIKFPTDKKLCALIVDVKDHIVTCLLPEYAFTIAYMPSTKHINEKCDASRRLKIGQNIFVKFDSKDDEGCVIVNSIDEMDVTEVTIGTTLTAVVKGIKPMQLSVTLLNGKMHGRVHISNVADDFEEGKTLLADFQPLQLIEVRVIGFKDMKTQTSLPITQSTSKALLELSMKPSVLSVEDVNDLQNVAVKKGVTVQCYVTAITKRFIWVSITPMIKGKISLLHFSNDEKELKKLSSFVKTSCCFQALVIGHNDDYNCTELSRIGDPAKLIVKGGTVMGQISRIMDHGILVELPNHNAGIANITELHDDFVDEPLEGFSVKQIVRCKILNVSKTDKIDLSLRPSRLSDTCPEVCDKLIDGYDDLKEGDVLRGYVKRCSKVGVFVSLSANIVGRVQLKNLSQFFVKNYVDLFPIGRLVKAKILSIDPANNNIDLSLRGKDVGGPDLCPPPKRNSTEDESKNENDDDESDNESSPRKKRKVMNEDDSETDSESEESDSGFEAAEEESEEDETVETPGLQLSKPFDWNAEEPMATEMEPSHDSDEETDNEEDSKSATKKSKRQKRAAKKVEEENLHKAELALLETKAHLESAEDFDRLILGSPDSSLVWIQYMAFHLHSAEVEKARAIGEKALKTISYREEQEKFNVWVALLNLESMYGTSESLDRCFQNALRVNDPKKIYFKMVDVYIKNEKQEEADRMYQTMVRKFRTSIKVWTGYGHFLMKTDQLDAARKLLQRSLKSLPQRKHIENIVKFAVMEYKMGERNRGSTIFESILKNYPKRTDLWSIYIDMNVKDGDVEQVRNIFERATALSMNSKKMKFLFKRYLNFEEQYGNKTTVEAVRKKALDYVENTITEDERME